MNILDYLNIGINNGVKAEDLMCRTGLSRRLIRKEVDNVMRNGEEFIGNMQDGSGYFIFDLPKELDLAKQYCIQERARAFAIFKRISRLEKYIKDAEKH